MNKNFIKKLFFIVLTLTCSFSASGSDEAFASPARPSQAAVVVALPDLTSLQIENLARLMQACIAQMQNVHAVFSTDTVGEAPRVPVAAIKGNLTSLQPLLLERLNPKAGKHITPECTRTLRTHLRDIAGDVSREFLEKGDADFMRSVNPSDFFTVGSHFGNTFFIPKWMVSPDFAFWRRATRTLSGNIEYGSYNIFKLLEGENPESHSGVLEHHHVYQNQGTVTPVCFGPHKKQTKDFHKSESESRIDRSICGTEFYFVNKLIGLLQIASMCERVLITVDERILPAEVVSAMGWVRNYTGNITIIFSDHAARRRPKRPETFLARTLFEGGDDKTISSLAKRRADEDIEPREKRERVEDSAEGRVPLAPIRGEQLSSVAAFPQSS
jgi:hypothetical protein